MTNTSLLNADGEENTNLELPNEVDESSDEELQTQEEPEIYQDQAVADETGGYVHFDEERALKIIESLEHDIRTLKAMFYGQPQSSFFSASSPISGFMTPASAQPAYYAEDDGIEGTFDGERMVDAQGKSYQVPPNYASKSKLIEGDPLKLYIGSDGKYVYKQLGPVERRNIGGILRMEGNHYVVDSDEGHTYSVLTACVTYYMALYSVKPGDRVMIMIPAVGQARWAVIDNPA